MKPNEAGERVTRYNALFHWAVPVGRELDADLVMVAWVDRVSGLILSLTYEIHDVKTNQITARQSFDFRGDNDTAWNHAIDYMVRHLRPT